MKHLLIIGRPRVGKTTLIKRLTQELRGSAVDGFYTEEVREDGERSGFWLSSLDGRQALLAHRHLQSPYRVGAYRVNVAVLDELAVSIIRRAIRSARILFLDEIGKMELFSKAFQQAVEGAIARGPRLVATGSVQRLPWLERLKRRNDVELIPLSTTNRQALFDELSARLQLLCDEDEQMRQVQQEADRICDLIVSGRLQEIDLEIQQAKLRDWVMRLCPDKPGLYRLAYENRFHRLWQQFRHV